MLGEVRVGIFRWPFILVSSINQFTIWPEKDKDKRGDHFKLFYTVAK